MSLGISTPGRTSPSQPELLHSDRADLNLHSSSTTSTGQLPELTLNDSSRSSPGLKAANTLNACSRSTDLIQSSTNTSNPNRPKTASPGDPGLPRTDWPLGLDFLIDADFGTEDVPDEYSLPDMSHLPWTFDPPSPADSETSATSSKYTGMSILRAPPSDPSSPEMLMLRFDRQTCGILSMKDGPSENPWRSHVWPLAKNSQALYHAILAMAAIHGTESQPQLKSVGMAHMTQSVRKFSLEMNKMSLEQALGTALALCLAEAWNDGPLTGIQHLKGARSLLSSVLAEHSAGLRPDLFDGEKAKCLRFLTCTFVYLDVMTRLTSTEELGNIDIEMLLRLSEEPFEGTAYQIDPRMGCATTLFPLLSRAADLILRVRKSTKNNLSVISEANELREQLLQWEPPDIDLFEQPEDVSSDARHALQTAEAYRRAMLLHLHHTVTELSSEPSQDQAMAVLSALAATPLSSRTTVVQVFPLLVGSCEVTEADDRQWVAQRWEGMMKRTQLANVASCWKVVQEAWRRRDIWTASQSQRLARTYSLNTPGNFEDEFTVEANPTKKHLGSALPSSARLAPRRQQVRLPRRHTDVSLLSGESEFTVRGNLHWLGVMSDFNCEGERSFPIIIPDCPVANHMNRSIHRIRSYMLRDILRTMIAYWSRLTLLTIIGTSISAKQCFGSLLSTNEAHAPKVCKLDTWTITRPQPDPSMVTCQRLSQPKAPMLGRQCHFSRPILAI